MFLQQTNCIEISEMVLILKRPTVTPYLQERIVKLHIMRQNQSEIFRTLQYEEKYESRETNNL